MDGVRVRAPELAGAGGWVGGDGPALGDLRGAPVLLDFFTAGCVNCLHAAQELREVERRFAGRLAVLGVHSPKFDHERDHAAVAAAAARLRLEHPVLDDRDRDVWDAYAVRAWPTLVLVDATGRVAARWSGEGHADEVAAAVEVLLAEGDGAGADAPLGPPVPAPPSGALAFPGAVAARPDGSLVLCDTGHDRVLELAADGTQRAEHAGLLAPQGACPEGDGLVVCETGAHRVWRVDAGGARTLVTDALKSPWGCCVWRGHLVVAEAGRHRLWIEDADGELQVLAGMGPEELGDGPALDALLAQPSGICVTASGELAWVDAESSAIRVLDRPGGAVRTLVGYDLFAWGDADGDASVARLQHPLGIAAAPEGALYVADTYNGLLRVWRGEHLWTIPVEGFDEPGGLCVVADPAAAGGVALVVADTGGHRLVRVDPDAGTAVALRTDAEAVALSAGEPLELVLDVALDGDALDAGAGGAAVRVRATATDPALLAAPVDLAFDALPARVSLALGDGAGRVDVELRAATCASDRCTVRVASRHVDVVVGGSPDA